MFTYFRIIDGFEPESVIGVAGNVAVYCPLIIFEVTPYDGNVLPVYGVYEELFSKVELCLFVFCDQECP